MTEQQNELVNWDRATESDRFVRLVAKEEKILLLTNYTLNEVEKFGKKVIEFKAVVLVEDGEDCKEKWFTTISRKLKAELRPIFEMREPQEAVIVSILKLGDKYNTNYIVRELNDGSH